MGLDAFVRCRCFEEHKLKPGPVPYEDLFIDAEGYLYSKSLSQAHNELGCEKYYEKYEELDRAFYEWLDNPCEHEFGEACSERVGNICGCASFRALAERSGGEEKFPLLSNMLPAGNGGQYPVKLAEPTLKELDSFIECFKKLDGWVVKKKKLMSADDDDSAHFYYGKESKNCGKKNSSKKVKGGSDAEAVDEEWCAEGFPSGLFWRGDDGSTRVDFIDGKITFHDGDIHLETTHFIETLLPKRCRRSPEHSEITCLDTGQSIIFPAYVREDYFDKSAKKYEFWVEPETSIYYHSSERYTLEALRRLLVASIELQNPIVWC